MNAFNRFSIRTKILGVVCSVIFMLGASAFMNLREFSNVFKHDQESNLQIGAVSLGERLGAQFYERYGDVQAFALNPLVASLKPSQEMQNALDQYVPLYGLYDIILVVDKAGNFVNANTKDISGKPVDLKALKQMNFKDQAWYKAVVAGTFTNDKDHGYEGTYFEDFMVDPVVKAGLGEDRFGTSFSAPIKNEKGELIGVITNRANKKWIENEVTQVYESMKKQGFDEAEITITNKEGIAIAYHQYDSKAKKDLAVNDPKVILVDKFLEGHVSGGEAYKTKQNGAVVSRDAISGDLDVLGFHRIDNPKWIPAIGWGAFVHDSTENAYANAAQAENNFYLLFGFCIFIAFAFAYFFGIVISKSLNHVTETLSKNSSEVDSASHKIASAATELSEAATEQAAALQETVAAVDEISAMVEKNADAANRSREMSGNSREAAEKGRHIVESMLSAIEDIDRSNVEISQQMDSSNRELAQITSLINDIGTKTKVINEIVFQTKLLSFNASVEAARAGEYGKGFAVVAEEVGNLAQMSGNAAKEITALLEESIRKVESIVSETKTRVERLMQDSSGKVKVGAQTARDCNEALGEILTSVQSVDSLVAEIAVASSEQSTGIREISKAVGQLEQVTQQNTSVAQSSSVSAEQLRSQAADLNSVVIDMALIVQGASKKNDGSTKKIKSARPVAAARPAPSSSQKTADAKGRQNENVIPLPVKKSPTESPKFEVEKQAAGSEFVPSSDDPGFGE